MSRTLVSGYYCNSYNPKSISVVIDDIFKNLSINSDVIKPNSKVLIKPNLLSAYTPEQAITTHPEIVRAVVKKIKELKAIPLIGDSPGNLFKGIETIWEKTGMLKVAQEENVQLVNFETSGVVELSVNHEAINNIHLTKALIDCDVIINLPKIKTHTFMGFTCAVKNFYGCVPGARKIEYHKLAPTPHDFANILSEIYKIVKGKLVLTIADGVCGLEGNGPSLSGIKRKYNMIIASRDAVALDAFILNLLKIKVNSLFLNILEEKKLGNTNVNEMLYIGDDIKLFNVSKVQFPVTWVLSRVPKTFARFLGKTIGKFVWVKPIINQNDCVGCLQCMKSCPAKAIIKQENKKTPTINKDKCISCFCCHELCPHKAINIEKSFLSKLFIK